ncbi:MAG: NblA/ycf18 family protein, partial [Cyanobacteriota bacterium]|nr:NblA/ycf18 family protein [Cyanobacteriota bacterium]
SVQKMNLEQAQEFLVELYQQMLIKETLYQHFLKQQWGIESGPGLE